MATSGQTLNDRINAARYALAGQGLARCVCKATTEEVIGPKKKHLDYLLACTHEPNVSIPQLANLLIERTNHIYWVVVFKALVTVHHLMSYGNERFTQYLASSNYSFELSTFLDKTAARDFSMSTFIRRYSRYINEKALSYRLLAFDFCKIKRGNDGVLRLMPIDRLLKTLPILQNQLDALLEFDCSANDLNNGVINACFMLLFRDLIGLFACHNDGIINLLNKYFSLNRKMCREAFDLYKKFLVRMDKVSDFLRVAEVVGIDKDEIPDLRRAPCTLVEALEQHLQAIESNKKILKQQQSTGGNKSAGEFSALGNSSPTSGRQPTSPKSSSSTNPSQYEELSVGSFRDEEVRKALEEEARVLSQYGHTGSSKGSSKSKPPGSDSGSPKLAVSADPATTSVKSIDDIFGDANSFGNSSTGATKASVLVDSNGSAFDNLSTTSSSSGAVATKHYNRSNMDSIKSAIQSATTTLEKSSNSMKVEPETTTKKASDDLFALLDTNTTSSNTLLAGSDATGSLMTSGNTTTSQLDPSALNPMSSFSPPQVELLSRLATPMSNGQSTAFKPGNPFPDVDNDFNSNFRVGLAPTPAAVPLIPNNLKPSNGSNNSAFKSTGPNYTSLGGLEGFGDLLQPMSASNKTANTSNGSSGFSAAKPSFNATSGLSSTGLFKGDLDSTLANLAQNLTFDGISKNNNTKKI